MTPAAGRAAMAFRLVLVAGLLLSLAANLPGHLSVDSVIALEEARTGVRQTWAPAVSSWLLGLFDGIVAGTGLYVTASAALLFLSLASLTRLRTRASWAAPLLALGVVLTPQVLIYQGIVWRDVLFANLAIAGFIFIAHAARDWEVRRPVVALAAAWLCLALAALVRQNGVILVVAAAVVLAWTARGRGWRSSLAWGLGGLAATLLLAAAINHVAQPPEVPAKLRPNAAALILQHYDIIGAKAHHPALRFTVIDRAAPAAGQILEQQAPKFYSAARIDPLDQDDLVRRTLWHVPDQVMSAQWREVILHEPAAYLLHRADVFRWVLLTPHLDQCLPVTVGVAGPPEMMANLEMVTGIEPQDQALGDYAARFYATPVYSHLTWVLVALAVSGLLLLRRDPADWVIVALEAGALLFVASFFVISVACDYRYLYLLDLAAMTGVLYLALDPITWPARRKSGA
ncbi:hypothetical protein DJ021_09290 [Phenylobacterium hankyongense]|uniref:Glycosyltransferase RgtA/B/C/D-like domain-containing protein n=1 Tax=Phenylobacterium hankyongense TaxID=1813876 RepID=A0A328AXZ0_9CAUL|nr:hypothetical protein [Phenylobacterium hankyongense]RAK59982.1 hypothetical protein DJ021_09290 [Phenylobacterium hankyongense]